MNLSIIKKVLSVADGANQYLRDEIAITTFGVGGGIGRMNS